MMHRFDPFGRHGEMDQLSKMMDRASDLMKMGAFFIQTSVNKVGEATQFQELM